MPRDLLTESTLRPRSAVSQLLLDAAEVVETKPDLSKFSLPGLSYLLRHPEAWPKDFVFYFKRVHHETFRTEGFFRKRRISCGTMGCAMGLVLDFWYGGRPIGTETGPVLLESITGMPRDDVLRIFMNADEFYGREHEHVTPRMVADAIDASIARRAAETV